MAKVAIMGYGTVGSGVYDIIKMNSAKLAKSADEEIEVKYILDIRDFPDHPEKHLFTKDVNDIINDSEISVVSEVMGGLHPAYEFTKQLLESGKSVVTSNKELVATYGSDLLAIAKEKNVNYMFEASVGGGIPVIRPLSRCLCANNIIKIAGILNGTTNYILYQMITNNKSFDTALKDAQANGYAERNPAADIEGHDACRKIAILASLASGTEVDYSKISTEGITAITLDDVKCAGASDYVIKLIGYAEFLKNGKVYAHVAPMLIDKKNMLSGIDDVMNGVLVTGDAVGEVMFYGPGAGKLPTASAVVADIVDSVIHRTARKGMAWIKADEDNTAPADEMKFRYFIRADKSTGDAAAVFGNVTELCGISETETAFITSPLTYAEAETLTAQLGGVKTAIRVLD
ncbi:MAG: homoserine dehydrogenase [Oscillospiraceae bacterium]|nr:homoserine dehydrogenase [Oscillospiraceae bacterium]